MKKKRRKCPICEGKGYLVGGVSLAMKMAGISPYSWKCECCLGEKTISVDYDPESCKISDNAWGNGGR